MCPEEGQLWLLLFYCATVAPTLPIVPCDLYAYGTSTVHETLRRYLLNGVQYDTRPVLTLFYAYYSHNNSIWTN